MARVLAGGCRVWGLKEGRPRRFGGVKVWHRAGRRAGAKAISLRVMELGTGLSPGIRATGDRSYRVLVDASVGCEAVTQFVGTIPPGRSPDHFHLYEEVLCILEGEGRLWAGRSHAAIGPGSCVFLPRRQLHCVENTGD